MIEPHRIPTRRRPNPYAIALAAIYERRRIKGHVIQSGHSLPCRRLTIPHKLQGRGLVCKPVPGTARRCLGCCNQTAAPCRLHAVVRRQRDIEMMGMRLRGTRAVASVDRGARQGVEVTISGCLVVRRSMTAKTTCQTA